MMGAPVPIEYLKDIHFQVARMFLSSPRFSPDWIALHSRASLGKVQNLWATQKWVFRCEKQLYKFGHKEP